MNFPFRYGVNTVLLNNGGTRFLDAEFILGVEPREGGLTTPWFVLGEADRLPGFTGTPRDVTIRAARGSRSAVIFDLDDDGDLDVVTSEFNAAPMVLVSDLAQRQGIRYLKVRLAGAASNRDGPRRGGAGDGRRPDLHAAPRRQVGLPVAELHAALLRPRRRRLGRAYRSAVAVGEPSRRCRGRSRSTPCS